MKMWTPHGAYVWAIVAAALMVTFTPSRTSAEDEEEPLIAPRCHHESCRYIEENSTIIQFIQISHYYYGIEGNTIKIVYDGLNHLLEVDCNGVSVDSPGMPRSETEHFVNRLILENCFLPASCSIMDTLETLNFTFCPQSSLEEHCTLEIINLPTEQVITAKHLNGLERLHSLLIYNENAHTSAESGFLAPLKSLRALRMFKVHLPAGEVEAIPLSLETLSLRFTGTERLSKAIYSSTNLRDLVIEEDIPLNAVVVPPSVRLLDLQSPATMLRLDAAPALDAIQLNNWVEPLPPKMTHCPTLRRIYLKAPAIRYLPYEWLANCSLLDELEILEARNMVYVVPKLFGPSTLLKRLSIRQGVIETWIEELLSFVPSLETLELDNNRLQTIPSSSFVVLQSLSKLNLSSNDLDGDVMDLETRVSIFGAGSLTELDLSNNPRIDNLCYSGGPSRMNHRTKLRKLDLSGTGVTHICSDWREDMPELELLNLSYTNISELSFADLQYTRKVEAHVLLHGAPVKAVRVTREDYNKAVQASPSFTSVHIDAQVECDCGMYWARRVLDHPLAQHTLPGIRELRCIGGGLLREVLADDLVCTVKEVCEGAELPEGCECVARPDEDPDQDRWLVRMRCENSSLGFVPRRIYPFYPLHRSVNNQGFYTQSVNTVKNDVNDYEELS